MMKGTQPKNNHSNKNIKYYLLYEISVSESVKTHDMIQESKGIN